MAKHRSLESQKTKKRQLQAFYESA